MRTTSHRNTGVNKVWLEGNWAETVTFLLFYWNVGTVSVSLQLTCTSLNRRRPLSVPTHLFKLHDLFSLKRKRCVFITKYWCKTKDSSLSYQISMKSNSHSLREANTLHSFPAAVNSFAKKSAGAYQTVPRLPYEPITMSQTGFKINQTAKQHHWKSLPPSVSPLLPQKWFTPPKNRVFLHGWFEEAQVCCVFRANVCVCAWARGNSGNHHPK